MIDPESLRIALSVTKVLDELAVPYAIGGSFASVLHGVPRSTVDADIVADMRPEQIGAFVGALRGEFYLDPLTILDAIQHHSSFNLIHLGTMFKVDIFLPKQRPFDKMQLERRSLETIIEESNGSAWVASAEDTILAKLEWFRMGGETSERQWRDVLGVLKIQGDWIDTEYLRTWAVELAVSDLMEQALIEAKRRE